MNDFDSKYTSIEWFLCSDTYNETGVCPIVKQVPLDLDQPNEFELMSQHQFERLIRDTCFMWGDTDYGARGRMFDILFTLRCSINALGGFGSYEYECIALLMKINNMRYSDD